MAAGQSTVDDWIDVPNSRNSGVDDWQGVSQSAPPEPTALDKILGYGKQAAGAIQNANIGAGKSALNTAYNIDKFLVNKLTPWSLPNQQDVLQPTNLPQKVGGGVEQAGEYYLAGRGTGLIADALKVGRGAGLPAKILSLIGRSAVEGAGTGGVSAAQGGDSKNVKTAAAFGAASPILGDLLNPVTQYLAQKLPGRIYNTIIRPGQNDYRFGMNPGKAVADEGITANTVGGLKDAIGARKAQVGQAIESAINATPNAPTVGVKQIVNDVIDNAQAKAARTGEKALVDRLESLRDGLLSNYQAQNGQLVNLGAKPAQASVLDAWQLKKDVGEATRWTGQAFDNDLNQARVAIYGKLKDAINNSVPEVAGLNERYANLLTAGKGIEKRIAVLQRNNLITPTDIIAGLAGGVGSASGGQDWKRSLENAGLGIALNKALGSTAVKTREAQALRGTPSADELIRLIRSGALGAASSQNQSE